MSESPISVEIPHVAQCFSCKAERTVKNVEILTTKNNRLRMKCECTVCGKQVSKFVPNPNASPKTPKNSPANGPKKSIQKKKSKKQNFKLCANCVCVTHKELIDAIPKKKRKSNKKSQELKDAILATLLDLEKEKEISEKIPEVVSVSLEKMNE